MSGHEAPHDLEGLRGTWESFGRADPLFAVLTERGKRGGRWDQAAFFASGQAEIASRLAELGAAGIEVNRGRALDFGCGVGRLTEALAEHFQAVDGVDISRAMVERARSMSSHGTCTYHVNVEVNLHLFATASFDFIYSSRVLQHTRPALVSAYLLEMARVLKPGGTLLFQLPTTPRWTAGGLLVRLTPLAVLRTLRRMEMIGMRESLVRRVLEQGSLTTVAIVSDDAAGPWWNSRRYTAVKPAA